MTHETASLKVLLIQVREVPEVAAHECLSLREVSGLDPEQIDTANAVLDPPIEWRRIERADAVIIGGAGRHSAVDNDPFTDHLMGLVQRMVEENVPLFGSCWGHQFIARALGGHVIHDPSNSEVGTHEVFSTDASSEDPVFDDCPRKYPVLMGHLDRVVELPDRAIELAYSHRCRNQAFRIEGRPVWGTQFHAELSPERLVERLSRYRQYAPSDDEFEEIQRSVRPTPEAQQIIHRFLEYAATR
ncbi:MAG: type 1 glutamine amidotransferase [Planctomycetota bacterium]